MNRFEHTSLWQSTLAKQLGPDIFEKQRELLRVEFESFRERAKLLSAEIHVKLPEYIVHDISHIDALWDTAELITDSNYNLTPSEAFVLGGAFLIHDLGMGLAAYPKGMDEIKELIIWKDAVTALYKKNFDKVPNGDEIRNPVSIIEKSALEIVLRTLHAKQAESLAKISWTVDGQEYYLINSPELRESYADVIGLIAHSHWWPVSELTNKLRSQLGAPGMFSAEWTVDPVKLACLLRIADAVQIDDRRAPSFLRAIRQPSGFSGQHWNFQQKLYQPRVERGRIVYTAKSPFRLDEASSWWLCYDTLKMINSELEEVDSLLSDTNRQSLKAKSVTSIEDPVRLSKLITVEGWQPVDTTIKVGNVAKLVSVLGGDQLYGKNMIVPLRELIQNAADAVRARRIIDDDDINTGRITIRVDEDATGHYVEVEDNGIGMSQKVLTGPFIDFGQSFWGSQLMHEEIPGLEYKGFKSTGKYGIGFFSIFMWGKKVKITSKKYDEGRDRSLVMEFNGLESRPLLRNANSDELIRDGGTRIKVWLSSKDILEKIKKGSRRYLELPIEEVIAQVCPALDVSIYYNDNRVVTANDWININSVDLAKRIAGNSIFSKLSDEDKHFIYQSCANMRLLHDVDGNVVGRASIYARPFRKDNFSEHINWGTVVVGGQATSSLTGMIGLLVGNTDRASREIGIPIIPTEQFKKWATDQGSLLSQMNLDNKLQEDYATLIVACGGYTEGLSVAYHIDSYLTYNQVKEIIKNNLLNELIVVQNAALENLIKKRGNIKLLNNVFSVEVSFQVILGQLYPNDTFHFAWPKVKQSTSDYWFHNTTLSGLVVKAASEAWECSIDDILSVSDFSSDEIQYEAIIGYLNGKPHKYKHLDIIRRPNI